MWTGHLRTAVFHDQHVRHALAAVTPRPGTQDPPGPLPNRPGIVSLYLFFSVHQTHHVYQTFNIYICTYIRMYVYCTQNPVHIDATFVISKPGVVIANPDKPMEELDFFVEQGILIKTP